MRNYNTSEEFINDLKTCISDQNIVDILAKFKDGLTDSKLEEFLFEIAKKPHWDRYRKDHINFALKWLCELSKFEKNHNTLLTLLDKQNIMKLTLREPGIDGQTFFGLLTNLTETDLVKVFEILGKEDEEHLGGVITNQYTSFVEIFIQFLADQGKRDFVELIKLLNKKDKDDKSISLFLFSRHEKRNENYIKKFIDMLSKTAKIHPEKIISTLNCNESDESIQSYLAQMHPEESIIHHIEFLISLCTKEYVNLLVKGLNQFNSYRGTFFHEIFKRGIPLAQEKAIELLYKILDQSDKPDPILGLINSIPKRNHMSSKINKLFTKAALSIEKKNFQPLFYVQQKYLGLLFAIKEKFPKANLSKELGAFGLSEAILNKNKDKSEEQLLTSIIQQLKRREMTTSSLKNHIHAPNQYGVTLADGFASSDDQKTQERFYQFANDNNDAASIYLCLRNGMSGKDKTFFKDSKQRDAVLRHIFKLTDVVEKYFALNAALDKNTSLGQFFGAAKMHFKYRQSKILKEFKMSENQFIKVEPSDVQVLEGQLVKEDSTNVEYFVEGYDISSDTFYQVTLPDNLDSNKYYIFTCPDENQLTNTYVPTSMMPYQEIAPTAPLETTVDGSSSSTENTSGSSDDIPPVYQLPSGIFQPLPVVKSQATDTMAKLDALQPTFGTLPAFFSLPNASSPLESASHVSELRTPTIEY